MNVVLCCCFTMIVIVIVVLAETLKSWQKPSRWKNYPSSDLCGSNRNSTNETESGSDSVLFDSCHNILIIFVFIDVFVMESVVDRERLYKRLQCFIHCYFIYGVKILENEWTDEWING